MNRAEYLVIGAGPTGLGAAARLQELGTDWRMLEAESYFGGLAASFVDTQGFTWDLGGHVSFSHYETFDRYMEKALPADGWLRHKRESWIWLCKRFIPYPLQNNIHRLPEAELQRCLQGLKAASERRDAPVPGHFGEWMRATCGEGLTDLFMRPYNFKVWAHPAETLGWNWIGERVAVPDYRKIVESLHTGTDDVEWGPNRFFTFPKHGGTGSVWESIGRMLDPGRVSLNSRVDHIDAFLREVHMANGQTCGYKTLISTMPLDILVRMTPGVAAQAVANRMVYSSVHTIGVGVEGQPPDNLATKCWMYFPESNSPYFRVTVFSNYSPNNVARPGCQWSLMAEVSESRHKPVQRDALLEDTLRAMREDGLLPPGARVCSTVLRSLDHAYPTPFLHRDATVDPVLRQLEAAGIYSRGRFGAWKYEVSNQDHSFAQGYECANRLVTDGGASCEPTLHRPSLVNSRRNP